MSAMQPGRSATDAATSAAAGHPGLFRRLCLALANRRFQVVVLGWCVLLTAVVFFPNPADLAVDSHVYVSAYHDMLAGRDAYTATYSATSDPHATGSILFRPPPVAALVAGPIGSLPAGDWWWLACNAAALAAAFLVVRSITAPMPALDGVLSGRARALAALVAWFLFQPNIQELAYGNQQALVLLGFAVMAWGLARGRPAATGAGLALATLVKAWPGLFFLPLLVGRRWREAGWFVALSIAASMATVLLIGSAPWVDFAHALASGGAGEMASSGYNMAPLVALLPGIPSNAWIAATAIALLAAGRLAPRRMLPAAIGAFLLLWPVVWMHYGGIALVALPMLLDDERLTPTIAVAWVLFALRVAVAWLPATVLLVGASVVPGRVLQAQDRIERWLARRAGTGETAVQQARSAGVG